MQNIFIHHAGVCVRVNLVPRFPTPEELPLFGGPVFETGTRVASLVCYVIKSFPIFSLQSHHS